MSKLSDIFGSVFSKKKAKSHMTGSAAGMSQKAETFVHCGCTDDKIHDVSIKESFDGQAVERKMCMFHIEKEIDDGKIVAFGHDIDK